MKDQKTWLKEIVDEAENMNKHYYDSCIKNFKKKGIVLDRIRKTIFLENHKNKARKEDEAMKEALKQYYESMSEALKHYYETWKNDERDKEN